MNNPNIMNAVGEALAEHQVTAKPDEQMADTVARALNITPDQAGLWLEALNEGCPVEEANLRAGVLHSEPLLVTFAKFFGRAAGSIPGA